MRFSRSASTRFMNSWKPSTAMRVRAPLTVLAVICRAKRNQITTEITMQPISRGMELKKFAQPVNCRIANGIKMPPRLVAATARAFRRTSWRLISSPATNRKQISPNFAMRSRPCAGV